MRWSFKLFAVLFLTIVVASVVVVLSQRRLKGAVPGAAPILSVAAISNRFAVGTASGLYLSDNANDWRWVSRFGKRKILLASSSGVVYVADGKTVVKTSDFQTYEPAIGSFVDATAMAADTSEDLYMSEKDGHLSLVTPDSGLQRVVPRNGPKSIIALAGIAGDPVHLLAGGISSGFWTSEDGGITWRQIIKTPTRALLVDESDPARVYLGTVGGLLVSTNGGLRWKFTDLRVAVEGITQVKGKVVVVSKDRVLFVSSDGEKSWSLLRT